jgi:hypothetical protein
MRGLALLIFALTSIPSLAAVPKGGYRFDAVEPGRTQVGQLRDLLGKPYRRVQESMKHEFYFYDLGDGATMDATVSVRSGVVEYVSWLCNESIAQVKARYAGEQAIQRNVDVSMSGFSGALTQLLFESKGRGFIFEPKTSRIRACVAWEPGKKFDELGK